MKNLKLFKNVAFAALVVLTAAGCVKNNNDNTPAPQLSAISFYNASPDAPSVGINIDQTRVNSGSFPFRSYIDYGNAYSGTREVSAYDGATKKTTGSIKLDEGKIYSLFLAGQWATSEFVLLEDSISRPAAGKAHIRFVNMSVGAPSLDLGVSSGTTVISGRTYKANSGYIAIDGDKQYEFTIRDHGQTVNKVTLSAITIQSGYNYTIWANGIYAQTGIGGLNADIVKNY